MKTSRLGLCASLAILGGATIADAKGTSAAVRRSASGATGIPATAARSSTASSFNRLTSTSRRGYAASSVRVAAGEIGTPGPGEYDPLRPYSEQARRSAAAISPTRLSEAPPPPPRMATPARYHYFAYTRPGQHPNAGVPHRCTPGRGSVMGGSLGRGR